jgi:2-polyprenyl-3-methyl-5-hydroxy-6-metoxy-1,4-benzoquinol methylase
MAYESAVKSAWADPGMAEVVRTSFLHESLEEALTAFLASEHWARVRRLLREAGVAPGSRVIDFGGGRGMISAALALEGFVPTLCEPNPSEIVGTGAARRLSELVPGGFEIVTGPVERLVGEEPYAAGVCRAVLHHVQPLAPALQTLVSVIRPGGVFIASDEPTIRHESELEVVLREHPFVPFGVEEWAAPVSVYRTAFEEAGFERLEVRFPVSLRDYRKIVHPSVAAPLVVAGYLRYRLRSRLRPHPGETRSIVAWAPAAGAGGAASS